MRVLREREDKFEVDPDWVLPQVMDLVPDGGRLDSEVRQLDNTYFDTPGAALRLFGITLRRRVGGSETGWLEGSQWDGADGTAKRLASQDTTVCVGGRCGGSAGR